MITLIHENPQTRIKSITRIISIDGKRYKIVNVYELNNPVDESALKLTIQQSSSAVASAVVEDCRIRAQ